MSETFTASNGAQVWHDAADVLYFTSGLSDWLVKEHEVALREFFTHERDQMLGRWRDQRWPELVVYPMGTDSGSRSVRVFYERTALSRVIREDRTLNYGSSEYHQAAHAWFEAHPARELPGEHTYTKDQE